MTVTFSKTAEPIVPPLLGPDEPASYNVINPGGKARCLLICDHASNRVPAKLGDLGIGEEELQKHAAWDIGVASVTEKLSKILDAPAILGNYSRMVVDLNRRLDHPTAFVTNAEGTPVPGNAAMSEEDRNLRISEIYVPYHEKVTELVDNFVNRDVVPAIISIHSFTPVFYNQVRPWEIAVLWVQDPRLPEATISYFRDKGYTVGDNEPYDARMLRGTTVNHHADARGLPNALVEVRNDLISDEAGCTEWAEMLGDCYKQALADDSLYSFYDGPKLQQDADEESGYFEELIAKAKRGEV